MPSINPEFVERYQMEIEKNPRSRIFAPLGEAYRQMGLLEEAHAVCAKGVQIHPHFSGGRVAFAKVLIDQQEPEAALEQLENAVRLSPDNLLAQTLLGEVLLALRRPKDALNAFKMVLFLNPNDDRALKAVKKWEFLSADEYDEELFKVQPVFEATRAPLLEPESSKRKSTDMKKSEAEFAVSVDHDWRNRETERAISLADAFTVRNDLPRAMQILADASKELGYVPEIDKRLRLLGKRAQALPDESPGRTRAFLDRERKKAALETLLQRINERRTEG